MKKHAQHIDDGYDQENLGIVREVVCRNEHAGSGVPLPSTKRPYLLQVILVVFSGQEIPENGDNDDKENAGQYGPIS